MTPLLSLNYSRLPIRDFDFLIIGSGVAGLSCALELVEHGTALLTSGDFNQDNYTNLIAERTDAIQRFCRSVPERWGCQCCHTIASAMSMTKDREMRGGQKPGYFYPTASNKLASRSCWNCRV